MRAAQVESSIHKVQRGPLGALVGFIRVYQRLDLFGYQSTYRCGALGREHLGLLHGLRAQTHGQVLPRISVMM
jgi:hypothetical protein